MKVVKEACVGSYLEAMRAYELGADRVELCDNLVEGGTTPSLGTIKVAQKSIDIPIFPIIRPRGGDFVFSEEEITIMEHDIDICRSIGVKGIVIGALNPDNTIDEAAIKRLINKASAMDITFHMAFDNIEDKKTALDILVGLGIHRVLTKGGQGSAIHNIDILRELTQYAGGGITMDNYMDIAGRTGVKEVHGTKIVGKLV